jgi:hypothetical protein
VRDLIERDGVRDDARDGDSITLIPNPARGATQLIVRSRSEVVVEIVDIVGRVVATLEPIAPAAGGRSYRVPMLGAGTYVIRAGKATCVLRVNS